MLTIELFNRNTRRLECVLCGGALDPLERNPGGEALREFCPTCVEQEFADDALELWSWFCGPDRRGP
jgi:hypothetical protein